MLYQRCRRHDVRNKCSRRQSTGIQGLYCKTQVVGQQRIENGTVNASTCRSQHVLSARRRNLSRTPRTSDLAVGSRVSITVKVFRNWLTIQVATLNVGDEWMWIMAIRSMFPASSRAVCSTLLRLERQSPDRIVQFCRKRIKICV